MHSQSWEEQVMLTNNCHIVFRIHSSFRCGMSSITAREIKLGAGDKAMNKLVMALAMH